jgi:hypothetical protein
MTTEDELAAAEPLDLAAVLQAHMDHDAGSIGLLAEQVDVRSLLALAVCLLVALEGEDRLRELIDSWRAEALR